MLKTNHKNITSFSFSGAVTEPRKILDFFLLRTIEMVVMRISPLILILKWMLSR